jgi:hypothetical protein
MSHVTLAQREYSLNEISKATGISSQYLSKRLGKRGRGFVEVKMAMPEAVADYGSSQPILIEVRRPDGTEIRVRCESREVAGILPGLVQ